MDEIEIICVDAGSTDGTLEILEEYAMKDPRVHILHSPVKSYGYQMNLGIDAAQGEYLAILETDDYIKPRMCEELYRLAEDNYLDIIKADYSIFVTDEENWKYFTYMPMITDRQKGQYNVVYTPADAQQIFNFKNVIWTGLYDLDFLRKNNIRFHESPGASYQDNGFWFLTMSQAKRLMYFEKDYYMLRRDNPDSSVHSKNKVFCMCDEYSYIREELRKKPDVESKFVPLLAHARFRNYEWTYERVGDEFKDMFLERFSKDFRELWEKKEIHGEYFNMEESARLRMILEDPVAYKFHRLSVDNRETIEIYSKSRDTSNNNNELSKLEHDLNCVHQSVSFKIGRTITWLPRTIRDFLRTSVHVGEQKSESSLPVIRDYNFYNSLQRAFYRTELQMWYQRMKGQNLDLDYPHTFNEKIQWLKLYNTTVRKTELSDVCSVASYVATKIGEKYLVRQIGAWKKFEEIDFRKLPESFTLKVNHGCKTHILVKNKSEMNFGEVNQILDQWLSHNFAFDNGFELQYMNISSRIVAEEYVEDSYRNKIYSVFCFHGKAECVLYEGSFFGVSGKRLDVSREDIQERGALSSDTGINWQELLNLAERLAEGIEPFVAIDFFVGKDGNLKFDKMSFTPESGIIAWKDENLNRYFGDKIFLPIKSPVPKYEGYDRMKKELIARGR